MKMRVIINIQYGNPEKGSDTPRIGPVPPPPGPSPKIRMSDQNDDNTQERELPRIYPPKPSNIVVMS